MFANYVCLILFVFFVLFPILLKYHVIHIQFYHNFNIFKYSYFLLAVSHSYGYICLFLGHCKMFRYGDIFRRCVPRIISKLNVLLSRQIPSHSTNTTCLARQQI